MSELNVLAQFAVELNIDNLPDEVICTVKESLLDTLGSALGAARYEEIPRIVASVLEFTGGGGEKTAAIWGWGTQTSVFQAVLLNGVMAHALELDDVHTDSKTHIGAVVIPAAWSLGEALNSSGKELIEAVVAGYEVMARIGKGFGVASHRKKGWHVTGTAGTFGAAAACAKLLKLNCEETTSALAMAGTQSSGLWAFLEDGATCKKLHTGRAAVNGLVAAFMAKAGMSGPKNILTANDGGLFKATSDNYNLDFVTKKLGSKYELQYLDKKPYPCCRSTHCVIDAALAVRENQKITPGEIALGVVETYEIGVAQCGTAVYPTKASEAKFSTPFAVASALIDGEVTLKQFELENISRDSVKYLAERIMVVEEEAFTNAYPDHWGCALTLKLKDGREVREYVRDASGSIFQPLTSKQVCEKFISLTIPLFGEERSERLLMDIQSLERLKVTPKI